MAQNNYLLLLNMLSSILRTVNKSHHAKTQLLRVASTTQTQSFGTLSRVARDVRESNTLADPYTNLNQRLENRGRFASKLPDFDVSPNQPAQSMESQAITQQFQIGEGYSRESPIETAAKEHRHKSDIYRKIEDNQILLTNLPLELEGTELATPQSLKQHLVKLVHKDLEVSDVRYLPALTTASQGDRSAYIMVTLGSKRQAHLSMRALRKTWFGDQMLKIRMKEDAKKEVFDNRTIMLRDIPTHFTQSQIIETFGGDYAVVSVELPVENVKVSKVLEERASHALDSNVKLEREVDHNKAAIAVQESLDRDAAMNRSVEEEAQLLHAASDATAQQVELMNTEKMHALIRMVSTLQAENIQVLQSKDELLKIRESQFNLNVTANAEQSLPTEESFKKALEENSETLTKVMHLLKADEEAATLLTKDTNLESLLKLSRRELSHAFDSLIDALTKRESIIEHRIGAQLRNFGIEERELLDHKNYEFELEDINMSRYDALRPEHIFSLNRQVANVVNSKGLTPEEKFQLVMTKKLNPYRERSWAEEDLKHAEAKHISLKKEMEMFDMYRYSKSLLRLSRMGSKFEKESEKKVKNLVSEMRGRYDIPFDELYHKEKGLVDAIVEAETALKNREASFDNLFNAKMVTAAEAAHIARGSLTDGHYERIFDQGQQRQETRLQKKSLQNEGAGRYDFLNEAQQELQEAVEAGVISQSQYDNLVQMSAQNETRNMGYCFLTFSHADEARMMMLRYKNPYLNGMRLQLDLKSSLDHSDMDFEFFAGKLRNDGRLLGEVKAIREARNELKEFEKDFDSHLPSRKKLEDFRKLARKVIEGGEHERNRNYRTDQRTPREEELLREKIAILEKKYPHVDMSQLFVTEKAEQTKRALHKNAFASYKAFEFLKHGINQEAKSHAPEKSEVKRRLEAYDPYNFPELDDTVAKVLSKDTLQPRILDHGSKQSKPGRRFTGYTENEFIEAYFGKDLMRNAVVDRNHDPLFREQKEMRERYPISEFLKMPEAQRKLKMLKEKGVEPGYKSIDFNKQEMYSSDPDLMFMQKQFANEFNDGSLYLNRQHPTDPKRNYLDDMQEQLKQMRLSHKTTFPVDTFDSSKYQRISADLRVEYQMDDHKQKDYWFNEFKYGELKNPVIDESAETAEGAEGEATEETQEAKFQANYDGDKKNGDKSKRRERKLNYPESYKAFEGIDKKDHELNFGKDDYTTDQQIQRVNREYAYNLAHHPGLHEEDWSKLHRQRAEDSGVTNAEMQDMLKDKAHLELAGRTYGGRWSAQQAADIDVPIFKETSPSAGGQTLEQFSEASMQDDEDIYEQYQRQINQRPVKEEPAQPKMEINKDLLQPDMPRFEEYERQQAQNIHPFDKITDEVNEHLKGNDEVSEAEKLMDRQLYQRELMGRLMGQKLTPRQYEIIAGKYRQDDAKLSHVKNTMHGDFLDRRESIKLQQEAVERFRRQRVMKGDWTEQESHQKLKEYVEREYKLLPGPHKMKQWRKDFDDVLDGVKLLDHPERVLEKEYYFDESLGESLDDHVHDLKSRYPGVTVQTRRDRDGFAVVKTLYHYEYKYDLDKLENWDADQARKELHGSISKLLDQAIPESPQDFISDLGQNLTERLEKGLVNQQYDLDSWTKLQIADVARLRAQGRTTDEELLDSVQQIVKQAAYDTSKPSRVTGTLMDEDPMANLMDSLVADREQFKNEIYSQLVKRVKKQNMKTKLKESDFVAPRVNEDEARQGQIAAHDRHIEHLSNSAQEEGFGPEEFQQMKAEIKERKAAKERLLEQGIPEFKAYLRF